MAKIFDTKVRARSFVAKKNRKARKYRWTYRKHHGGWLVYRTKK